MPRHFIFCSPGGVGNYNQAFVYKNHHLIISLSGSSANITLQFGHDLIAKIQEFIDQESPNLIALIKELLPAETQANILVAKFADSKVTISADGQVKSKLLRGGQMINLTNLPGTISGPVKQDDYLIFGTNAFFENIFSPDIATNQEALLLKMESLDKNLPIVALTTRVEEIDNKPLVTSHYPLTTKFFLRTPPPPRKILTWAMMVLVFLLSLIAFQLRSRDLENRTKNVIVLEQQIKKDVESADKLAGINDNLARESLSQSKANFLSRANEIFGSDWQKQNSAESKKLKAALVDLETHLSSVSHIYKLENLDVFSDFSLLRPDAKISTAGIFQNEIVAIDSNNGAAYSLKTKAKTAAIVGGAADFKNQAKVDLSTTLAYVWTPAGIETINKSSNVVKLLLAPSTKWGNIGGLKVFAGNIYLLDTGNSQIWKYQGTDLGFMEIAPYLRTGSADLSKVTGFAIDGSIYVVSSTGNIAKFSGGYPEDFAISGLDTPLQNPLGIFTSDETKNIYILDTGRVVILDKKGVYQSQYLLPVTNDQWPVTSLLADESINKVFLFSEGKVYSFDLR